MKRFLSFLALTLLWPIWRAPAWAQLTTLGVGGVVAVAIGMLTPPSIVPLPGSYFNVAGPWGFTNNGLQPNGGTVGAFQLPGAANNSMVVYFEGSVDPALTYYNGGEYALSQGAANRAIGVSSNVAGQPAFLVQNNIPNASGSQWWNAISVNSTAIAPLVAVAGTNYATGAYPFTMTGSGCARDPTGVWAGGGSVASVDPGFLCPGAAPTISAVNIPGDGAQQSTGSGGATTCVSNSPVSGEMTVTAHLAVAHGLSPGQTYTMQGFSNLGFTGYGTSATTISGGSFVVGMPYTIVTVGTTNFVAIGASANTVGVTFTATGVGSGSGTARLGFGVVTYTALAGTTGSTLVGETTTGGGTCPTSPVTGGNEGTALSGTGGSITATAISTTAPWNVGMSGVVTKNSQHFCAVAGEYGADSAFPGGHFFSAVDDQGNVLRGAPALVPWLNQGTANFTGYVLANTQSPSSPALVVTAMNPYTISAASYSAGLVTFTTTVNPGFIPGSEFTVSGVSPSGYNQTYVAVAGTSGTNLVGNPLSGPVGTPQALSNPGAYSSGGTLVSVIMPGMQVWGAASTSLGGDAIISPYGTFSSTGVGGVGTYGLTTNQPTTTTFTATGSLGASVITASATHANQPLVVGDALSGTGIAAGTVITSLGTGTGGSGTYNISNPLTATLSGSLNVTMAGTIGSSGAPVNLFAFAGGFYFTAAGSTNAAGGVVTARTQTSLGDFYNLIGTAATANGAGKQGWGGALANISMLWGAFPQTTGGAPDTTALASLCKKTTDINSFATANSLTVHSLYRMNDPGLWADSSAAFFKGYITNSTGTNATLNLVGSPQYGALTGSTTVVIAGPGVPGCPLACPTTTLGSGPTYALTPNTTAALGSSGSPVAMTAGAFKPAKPLAPNKFNGYIDSPGGVPTLHVTSVPPSATFTGTLGNLITAGKIDNGAGASGNILTVTTISPNPTIRYPQIAIGSLLTGDTIAAGTHVTGYGTGTGLTGTYTVDTPQLVTPNRAMFVSGVLPSAANDLQTDNSSVTGTLAISSWVSDGGLNITDQPLSISQANPASTTGFSNWAINQTYTPPFTSDTALTSTATILVPGQQVIGTGITTPVSIIGYGTGTGGVGTYLLSNSASSGVGSSGSPVALTSTGIQDGPAVAPGRALTIRDQGAGVTYPATSISCSSLGSCTGTGALTLSGTFDTSLLGGTPTAIQAQVSLSSGGPAVPGCSACAWTTLTGYSATLSSGTVYNWSGQAVSIPAAAGPLYVSVRAANGAAYATMPSFIKVGLVFDWQGEGQLAAVVSNAGIGNIAGTANSYFTGLWGLNLWRGVNFSGLDTGPAISGDFSPAFTQIFAGDAFSELQGGVPISEASNVYAQLLTNAFGWPVTVLNATRDGIGMTPETMGNVIQNQTIAVGDGSKTTFCSASKFCANVAASGPLVYSGATQTGAAITALIDDGTGTSTPGNVLTTSAQALGALEPGMTISGSGITGAPTLLTCTTGCGLVGGYYPAIQKWTISGSAQLVTSRAMRGDLGATPWPNYDIQSNAGPGYSYINTGFGTQFIKAGSFKITVNGTVVCQDNSVFAYNAMGGNCTGAGISSSFVNYVTGDYQVTFSVAPASNAVINASWLNIITPDATQTTADRPVGIDFFGDGTKTSGPMSSMFDTAPGGVSGHVFGGGINDAGILGGDYAMGASGYTQAVSWLYATKFPSVLPGESASTPFMNINYWRGEGPVYFTSPGNLNQNARFQQWGVDSVTKSTWTGAITGAPGSPVLTLSGAATGPMWEGEPIGIAGVPSGDYIIALTGGAWGASGSTYSVGNAAVAVANVGSSAMNNSAYYLGPGPAFYAGPMNDVVVQQNGGINGVAAYSPHPSNGFTGGRRIAARMAAATYGGLTTAANASNPTLDRVKANASGCDAAALAAPCFDVGNTFAASESATMVSASPTITVTGGIAAHDRPFVVGQALSCAGCTSGRFITSIDVPPTQSTVAGAGEVGQTFHITANGNMGVSATETLTGGCSGTSGTGSNCIDVAIQINTTNGAYGTTAAIATCGEDNLSGNAPPYQVPNGICQTNGIGSLVRNVRIGTQQNMWGGASGSVQDDGVDANGGFFTRNATFTCNIVAAKVMQCVKGAAYTLPSFSVALGQWSSGATFIEYGDPLIGTSRIATLMGNVGGQPMPFTAGSGYTNSGSTPTTITGSCTLGTSGVQPKIDVIVAGGKIVDAYPSSAADSMGLAIAGGCSFSLTALGGGTGGAITAPVVAPFDGASGIATFGTDSNMMGDMLYDNSGLFGNPLNMFFSNHFGGYFEPGLPVRPWGNYLGVAVSG